MIEKKDPTKVLDEFINAVPKKRMPKKTDWDAEYYSQFED